MLTYDLELIRVDIERRVRIQLAGSLDLDGVDVEVIESVEVHKSVNIDIPICWQVTIITHTHSPC